MFEAIRTEAIHLIGALTFHQIAFAYIVIAGTSCYLAARKLYS